jgi:hypothetical protein
MGCLHGRVAGGGVSRPCYQRSTDRQYLLKKRTGVFVVQRPYLVSQLTIDILLVGAGGNVDIQSSQVLITALFGSYAPAMLSNYKHG